MKQYLSDLLESDPSKVAGRLVLVLAAAAAFLAKEVVPQLEGVKGWGDAAFVVFIAVWPRIATGIAALRAYKPSTANALAHVAFNDGVDAAEEQARVKRSEASRKGKAAKKATLSQEVVVAETETTKPLKKTRARKFK